MFNSICSTFDGKWLFSIELEHKKDCRGGPSSKEIATLMAVLRVIVNCRSGGRRIRMVVDFGAPPKKWNNTMVCHQILLLVIKLQQMDAISNQFKEIYHCISFSRNYWLVSLYNLNSSLGQTIVWCILKW